MDTKTDESVNPYTAGTKPFQFPLHFSRPREPTIVDHGRTSTGVDHRCHL